jgi:GDP-mannose 6-dehydrogenase
MKISVFGLGRVGAVSAACLASLGHSVTGLDPKAETRRLVAIGRSPFVEPGLQRLLSAGVAKGTLAVSDNVREALGATALSLVCVGTPIGVGGAFDAQPLASVSEAIGAGLVAGHTVVIRSTALPGTARDVVIPTLEKASGLRAGVDFSVAVAPEFLREGTAIEDFFAPPQTVIGADNPDVASRVASLFEGVDGPLSITTIELAEMVKYVSNTWHGLKIAFANEIGSYCRSLAIDEAEVMRIFAEDQKLNLSKRYLRPGFAFGGPCLIKDIEAFTWRARELGLALPLVFSILPSNDSRIEESLELILRTGKRAISVLGLSYKVETDDIRSSPYLELCHRLIANGRDLRIFDPLLRQSRHFPSAQAIPDSLVVNTLEEALMHGDLIVIGTPHQAFVDIRRRLKTTQSLIDLARGTLEPSTGI